MQYTKQAMDFYCQLDILKERGLTIEDEEDAIKISSFCKLFSFCELPTTDGTEYRIT